MKNLHVYFDITLPVMLHDAVYRARVQQCSAGSEMALKIIGACVRVALATCFARKYDQVRCLKKEKERCQLALKSIGLSNKSNFLKK